MKDPLAADIPPRVIRIPLNADQTAQLAAAGAGAFNIISRRSYPGDPGRWIVTVAPVSWDRAVAASGVLLGSHRAVRIQTPKDQPVEHGLVNDTPPKRSRLNSALTTQR